VKLTASITGAQDVRRMLLRLGTQLAAKALAQTAVAVERYVELEAGKHTKTGALFQSVRKRQVGAAWVIDHDLQRAPHAVFVHWGTRPHIIRPKNKKALRWPAGGAFAFAKKVRHPGTKADPWMVRAAALAPAVFRARVEALVKDLNNGA
jgi:hypothetical protein